MLLSSPGHAPKVLIVASAVPGDGKTTTAINIAIAFAQSNRRVLLVDADMRNSGMKTSLGIVSSEGLSQYLTSTSECASALISIPELPTLRILPSGPRPPSPAELLGSERMLALLKQWRTEYDHIVFDTPPVLGLTDAAVLATMADAVLMVVRCSKTGRQSLLRARDILAGVNSRIVGLVINDLNRNSSEHYGYYGYYGDHLNESYGEKALSN